MTFHLCDDTPGYSFRDVDVVNVLLGKNGSGKSRMLRAIERDLFQDDRSVLYITPERGGELQYDPTVERNYGDNDERLHRDRRSNRINNFRNQTLIHYRSLERQILRGIETDPEIRRNLDYTFDNIVDRIDELLDNISIEREGEGFRFVDSSDGELIGTAQISSGETEIVSLAIECMAFAEDYDGHADDHRPVLFLDEPDLHLHPDLQTRFARFLYDLCAQNDISAVLATHSTAMIL